MFSTYRQNKVEKTQVSSLFWDTTIGTVCLANIANFLLNIERILMGP